MTVDLTNDRTLLEAEFLLDTCAITRPATSEPVWDSELNVHTAAAATEVWSGACSVSTLTGRVIDDGGLTVVAYTHVVRVPHVDGPDARPGDVVTVTAVRDGGNTELVDVDLVVVEVPEQSTQVFRRLGCARRSTSTVPL